MKFRPIEDQRDTFKVRAMCDVLGVSPAGYYGPGVIYAKLQWEGLWDKFYVDAPARQRQYVEHCNIVKRA
jgi:hypothetical protein